MESWVWSLGWEELLEKGKATHSSILSCRIPWTEEPVGYSPWSSKESDTTEQLSMHAHVCIYMYTHTSYMYIVHLLYLCSFYKWGLDRLLDLLGFWSQKNGLHPQVLWLQIPAAPTIGGHIVVSDCPPIEFDLYLIFLVCVSYKENLLLFISLMF